MPVFEKTTLVHCSPEQLFAFHERPDAFALLTPPWEPVRVVERHGAGLEAGARLLLEVRVAGLPLRWSAVHVACERPRLFVDEAQSGPFRRWRHEHRFEPHPEGALLVDHVDFELPFGLLGRLGLPLVRRRLERMFNYRHDVTVRALADVDTAT